MTDRVEVMIERLRAIPVWMVGEMTPGWQEHGTTAYHAADMLAELRDALRPFAHEFQDAGASHLPDDMLWNDANGGGDGGPMTITVGDLRRARNALTGTKLDHLGQQT